MNDRDAGDTPAHGTNAAPGGRLADEWQIRHAVMRYARGVDRRNWEMVRSAYHPGAFDNHGACKGCIEDFIDVLKTRHMHISQSLHTIANVMVDFAGPDLAVAESYFVSYQRLPPECGDYRQSFMGDEPVSDEHDVEIQVCGRYVDRFSRRQGEWRIERRTVVYESLRTRVSPLGGGLNPKWERARRDGHDPLEIALQEAGLPSSPP